jgi:hypothetical protein
LSEEKEKGQQQLQMMKRKFTSSRREEKRHLLRFASPLSQKNEAIRQKSEVQEDLDELDELTELETKLFGFIVA